MAPTEPSVDQLAAFEQMREQVSPTEINREMLMTAEQADPVAVAEFRKELAELEVAPEVIDMLNTMVDEVLANPNEYPAIRQKYLDMGVDEEILPEAFDAGLFAALNIALDELRGPENMLPPQSFARGGIASLNPMAREMAEAGRYGDTMLAHISPVEAQILRRYGGSGTINPMTGMPEFFLKKMFKKLGKAVKKFANTTIGKIVIGTALFMVAGPAAASMLGASAGGAAAAGISGFVSGVGTSLLAGGNLKDSLKAGAIGGITAGVSKGVMNRMGTPAAAAAPEIAQQPLRPVDLSVPRGDALPLQSISPTQAAVNIPPGGIGSLPVATDPTAGRFTPSFTGAEGIQDILAQASRVTAPIQPPASSGMGFPRTTAAPGTLSPGTTVDLGALDRASPTLKTPGYTPRTEVAATGGSSPRNLLQQGGDRLQEFYSDKLSPDRFDAAAAKAGEKAFDDTFAQYGGNRLVQGTDAHTTAITKANEAKAAAIASNTPGPFRQFAPLAATGLGIMALTGGFEQEEVAPPEGFEEFMSGMSPGERYLEQNPDQRIRYGGAYTTSTTPQFNPYSYTPPPTGRAKGGSMDKEFPRKTGPINGPGTGTSDDIPAMLSDGEFVFTAKAVRNMGDGSRRKGAQRMYALMRKLEGRKNG
jgi:hypothetical protein